MIRALLLVVALVSPAVAADPAPCVRVQRETDKPYMRSTGSGTVVRADKGASLVLTCKHVAPDGKFGLSVQAGDSQYAADFVAADDRCDLAIVRVKVKLTPTAVADVEPAAGATLYQWGYPHGGPCKHKWGPLTSERVVGAPEVWIVGICPEGGDSGAGVFDDRGRLVGVVFAGTVGGQGVTGPASVTRLADVRRFLKAWEK